MRTDNERIKKTNGSATLILASIKVPQCRHLRLQWGCRQDLPSLPTIVGDSVPVPVSVIFTVAGYVTRPRVIFLVIFQELHDAQGLGISSGSSLS
ncbi:hypothetical protein J6590_054403 [Homalodisca vitripennis]|nr:hypothetical protein J6590_054403 [Homalodisca vitripennis]